MANTTSLFDLAFFDTMRVIGKCTSEKTVGSGSSFAGERRDGDGYRWAYVQLDVDHCKTCIVLDE